MTSIQWYGLSFPFLFVIDKSQKKKFNFPKLIMLPNGLWISIVSHGSDRQYLFSAQTQTISSTMN